MDERLVAGIDALHARAAASLPPAVSAWLQDGDGCGNAQAFDALRIVTRLLQDTRGGSTRLTLCGEALDHPILLAPIAYLQLLHPDGETAVAMAAAAQGGQMAISSLSSQPLAEVVRAARDAGGRSPWFQLYWQGDRERTQRLLDRAITAGCSRIVFTADAPVKRATLELPDSIRAVNLEHGAEAAPAVPPGKSAVFDGWMAQAPAWNDFEWLRRRTSGPLLLKGVLHPDDALRAFDCGCDGVIVSNHGGRVLDRAPLSLFALRAVAARIGGRIPVLLDGGLRRGEDVFTALALGASAVMIGRPYAWGLAADGAMGAARVIRILRDELEMTMALAGCASLRDITPSRIWETTRGDRP